MYVRPQFAETDTAALHDLVRTHPLGTWITQGSGELLVSHVPFVLDATRGPHGTLACHVPRANPIWRELSRSVPSVVVFQGPNAYISPSWYPSKHAHGKAVPTWNFVAVHAHGMPVVIDDKRWLLAHLNAITDAHEATQTLPWRVADAPADYLDKMLEQLVGVELPIDKLVGKWKLSQNRPEADRLGVVAGLLGTLDPAAHAIAALVRDRPVPNDR
jgi:transcriptional regulator